jgi:tetraacyldisaccharide 4'-kinase
VSERATIERLWWGSDRGARLARALLAPASGVFGAIVRVRNALYDRGALPVHTPLLPALSVGNLTAGGTGKTPIASWLATRLAERGAHPAIVLRGYGGDEALVHARLAPSIPVFVNADRAAGIAAASAAGADVAVLDDAFQHRRVARAADIVLLSADTPRAPVQLLPAGPYRERPRALRRASLAIVTRKAAPQERAYEVAAWARAVAPAVPVSLVHIALDAVHRADEPPMPLAMLAGRRVCAIAGIGNAGAFATQLVLAGATVRLRAFPDHHPFSAADAATLARELARDEMALCTLKDAVKLLPLWPREAPAIGYVSQTIHVEERGEAIDALLEQMLLSSRRTL